jgi:hypothetical protein
MTPSVIPNPTERKLISAVPRIESRKTSTGSGASQASTPKRSRQKPAAR